MDADLLLEILDDLRHDLGKHLALPLRMLPADAGPELVREAAHTALLRTRRGPTGDAPASALWATARDDLEGHVPDRAWTDLEATVEVALAWTRRLDDPIDRARLTADLTAVGRAIDALMNAVEDDC